MATANTQTQVTNLQEYKLVDDKTKNRIKPQFDEYCFIAGPSIFADEKRMVYLYGNCYDYERKLYQETYKWVNGLKTSIICEKVHKATVGTADNKYVGPVGFMIPFALGDEFDSDDSPDAMTCSKNYFMGTTNPAMSCSINVKYITKRDYNVNYYYMTGNDLRDPSVATKFEIEADAAFIEAGTNFNLIPNNCNPLEYKIHDLTQPNVSLAEQLFNWYNTHYYQFFSVADDDVFLMAVDSIVSAETKYSILGDTYTYHFGTSQRHLSFSAVFTQRIKKLQNLFNPIIPDEYIKKYITQTAIHELGHARGHNFEMTNGAIGYGHLDITDAAHVHGHNGTGNSICLMRYLNINSNEWKAMLDKPRFCEGHKQMLFNTDW
ncbi:MAG: hypothetical protein HYV28_05165 [Ignavibacteriales bacterium]|nr:hypothetical protein [Ignavibacteriales bacterium]